MHGHQIAVIDDEAFICDLIAEYLGDHGAVVHCANTRDDGIALLKSRQFAVVLIDAVLPGGSGLGLLPIAANAHTPAVIITGHPDAAGECDRFGVPYLGKPFGLDALAREARKVLADREVALQRMRDAVAKMDAEKGSSAAT